MEEPLPARIEKSGFWVTLTALVFYPIVKLAKVVATGAHQIRVDGPVLLVMNHISHFDPPIDAVFVHRNGRVPRFLAKESLFRAPVFKYLIKGAGSIPVHRRSAGAAESVAAASEALRKGRFVVIYPEGTITRDPQGWPMRGMTGVARLALENDVRVIPAARWGTKEIFDGYTRKFRPFPRKTVTISFGEPVDLSAYRGKPITHQALREVTDLLMTRIRDLLAEIRQEPAPVDFFRPPPATTRPGGKAAS